VAGDDATAAAMSRKSEIASLSSDFHIWEGVYPSFAEARAVGAGFNGPTHKARATAAARAALDSVRAGKPIPLLLKQRSAVLPPVVACALSQSPAIRVLDFGGGLGIGYLALLESIPQISSNLDYQVVDLPEVCASGRALFHGLENISFAEALPPVVPRPTLVYSSSAIQYVESWRNLLEKLTSYRADAILLSDVFAGNIPTFCSLQNYYDSKVPQWFFNIDELVECVAAGGYRLQMKTRAVVTLLDREDGPPMDNFPATHRIPETLHLLFQQA
jgi:putative methyltransferase (TIGR04325 family)